MKKITYKQLRIQNFLSVGKDVIQLDFPQGLNQIDGKNIDEPDRKNAVGKSVIMQGHFYALFGETINKIKKEFIPNNFTNGKGMVELDFDVSTNKGTISYTIKRQIKPSKVELWCGDKDITLSSIAETNKYICDLLQTNPTIHRCCDIMTIRDTTPFMEMDASDKRKFVEDIFSIDIFGKMLKDLKKMISDNSKDVDISSARLAEIKNSVLVLIKQRESIIQSSKDREERLKKRKDDINDKIKSVKDKIEDIKIVDSSEIVEKLKKLKDGEEKISKQITTMSSSISVFDSDIRQKKSSISKIDTVDSGVTCDECLQSIPHTHVEFLEKKKSEYTKELDNLVEIRDKETLDLNFLKSKKLKIQTAITNLQKDINENDSNKIKRDSLKRSLDEYEESLNEVDVDMENSSDSVDSINSSIEETEKREEDENKNLITLREMAESLKTCKFILGEEGVKSFAIKKLLSILNSTIEMYLVELGLNLRCKFDEYFEEIITDSKGTVMSYKNGSGAEKKSLDFACAFSFSDMRRKINQISSNVEFYDEIFDSALCSSGLDLLMGVIKKRIEDNKQSVYVISHRTEMKKHVDGEYVYLEKENKVTRRINI